MVAYARQQGGDEEAYAVTGLLHDFDWEIHPTTGEAILQERGLSRGNSTGDSFACRFYWRQAGLADGKDAVSLRWTFRVSPAVLVREAVAEHPRRGRKIVAEKVKGKAIARAVNRDDVINGAAEMGLDLDAHIEFCIWALQNRAELLGLQGTVQSRKPILAGAGPGLQNQRTSRKRRGGFDSHWLPPHPLTYYTCRNSLFGNGYWVLSAPS